MEPLLQQLSLSLTNAFPLQDGGKLEITNVSGNASHLCSARYLPATAKHAVYSIPCNPSQSYVVNIFIIIIWPMRKSGHKKIR